MIERVRDITLLLPKDQRLGQAIYNAMRDHIGRDYSDERIGDWLFNIEDDFLKELIVKHIERLEYI